MPGDLACAAISARCAAAAASCKQRGIWQHYSAAHSALHTLCSLEVCRRLPHLFVPDAAIERCPRGSPSIAPAPCGRGLRCRAGGQWGRSFEPVPCRWWFRGRDERVIRSLHASRVRRFLERSFQKRHRNSPIIVCTFVYIYEVLSGSGSMLWLSFGTLLT